MLILLALAACFVDCYEGEIVYCPDEDGDDRGSCSDAEEALILEAYYFDQKTWYCTPTDNPAGYAPAVYGQDCDDTDPNVSTMQGCFWPEDVCLLIEDAREGAYNTEVDCEAGTET